MGNSIESRLPFLDYRIMECGIALPEAMKLRGGHGKWIVRRAMAGKIPESIRTARYKKGFDVQQDRWIDGGLGDVASADAPRPVGADSPVAYART